MKNDYLNKIECRIDNIMWVFLKSKKSRSECQFEIAYLAENEIFFTESVKNKNKKNKTE